MNSIAWKAEKFAEEKHRGQFDRAGVPYIEHPRVVASKLEADIEKAVAFLHDTVEDTDATIDEIRDQFGDEVADAVECLTRKKGVPYMKYIEGIKKNGIARKVKIADLSHNMDLSRLPVIKDADRKRYEKYSKAFRVLSED